MKILPYIQASSFSGTFLKDWEIKNLSIDINDTQIYLDHAYVSWRLTDLIYSRQMNISRVDLGDLSIKFKRSSSDPIKIPKSLRLPFPIIANHITLKTLRVNHVDIINQLHASYDYKQGYHSLNIPSFHNQWVSQGKLYTKLGDQAPFKVEYLSGFLQSYRMPIDFKADGTLDHIHVRVKTKDKLSSAVANMSWYPFASELSSMFSQVLVEAKNINPRSFHPMAPMADLSGHIKATLQKNQLQGYLSISNRIVHALDVGGIPVKHVSSSWVLNEKQWIFDSLDLTDGYGTAHLVGSLTSSKSFAVWTRTEFKAIPKGLNPRMWWSTAPEGRVLGQLSMMLDWSKHQLKGMFDAKMEGGELLKKQLRGTAKGSFTPRDLTIQSNLNLAGNYLDVNGTLSKKISLDMRMPNLSYLGFGLKGDIRGHVELDDILKAPSFKLDLYSGQLSFSNANLQLQKATLKGALAPGRSGIVDLSLDVNQINTLGYLHAHVKGTREQHVMSLDGQDMLLQGYGGLYQTTWKGSIKDFQVQKIPMQLLAPVSLVVSPSSIRSDSFALGLNGSQIMVSPVDYQSGRLLVPVRIQSRDIHLNAVKSLLPPAMEIAGNARWHMDGMLQGSIDHPQGQLQVKYLEGDILLSNRIPLKISRADMQLAITSQGQIWDAYLDSQLIKAQTSGKIAQKNIDARFRANIEHLDGLSKIFTKLVRLDGSFAMQGNIHGTLEHPYVTGSIQGKHLSFYERVSGIHLKQGTVQASLDKDTVHLEKLEFFGKEGRVYSNGRLVLDGQVPSGQAKIHFEQFSLFDRPDKLLILSGDGDLGFVDGVLKIKASVKADKTRIDLSRAMAPKLPDDVFVKGSEKSSHVLKNIPETGQQLNIPIRLAVDVDLGDDSKILGQGLDVRLAGSVHLENEKHTLIPSAIGKVTIPYGRYKAYGQELDIDRSSTISFDGLLDDPHIYVIAKRRFSPVGAGIKISGRVSKREMTLIADEPLSERDKFAWLALGRSGSSNEDDASLMLATSAGSLLAQGLNAELGIFDTLGLSSKEGRRQGDGSLSPSEQIITIGKQLSKELSIGYEYSLNTSKQIVRVAYEFKRNWSAIVRFGNSPSVEGRYSKRFD